MQRSKIYTLLLHGCNWKPSRTHFFFNLLCIAEIIAFLGNCSKEAADTVEVEGRVVELDFRLSVDKERPWCWRGWAFVFLLSPVPILALRLHRALLCASRTDLDSGDGVLGCCW